MVITICLFLLTDLLAHAVEAPEDWELGGGRAVLLLLPPVVHHHALPAALPGGAPGPHTGHSHEQRIFIFVGIKSFIS